MEISDIAWAGKYWRSEELITEIRALPPLGPALAKEIRESGRETSFEALVTVAREAYVTEHDSVVDACGIAFQAKKNRIESIIRGAGVRCGLWEQQAQEELLDWCVSAMWRRLLTMPEDRPKHYLWEVRFGLALRRLATGRAVRIAKRLRKERAGINARFRAADVEPDSLPAVEEPDSEYAHRIDAERAEDLLANWLLKMPDRLQRVAELYLLGPMTESETAEELGVSPRTVRRDKHYIRETLRKVPELARYLEDLGIL